MFSRLTTGLGVDISEHHIRFAVVSFFGAVKHMHEIEIPEGIVVDAKVRDAKKLQDIIQKESKKLPWIRAGVKATVLIPDSRVFFYGSDVSRALGKTGMSSKAKREAQKQIPLPFSKANVAVSYGEKTNSDVRATVYAVEKEVVQGFQEMFAKLPISIAAIESNSKALFRMIARKYHGLKKQKKDVVTVIVDFGHSWTSISAYSPKGACMYSRSLSHTKKSETTKKYQGEVVDVVANGLNDLVVYLNQEKYAFEQIFLTGVEAQESWVQDIVSKVSNEMPLKTIGETVKIKGVSKEQMHVFGAAIGAALRSTHSRHYHYQHNLR